MLSNSEEWREAINVRTARHEKEKEEKAKLKEENKNCCLCGKRILIKYMTSDDRGLCV